VITAVTDGLERTIGMPEEFMTHRTPTRAKEFAEACQSVAKEDDVECLDVFAMHDGKEGMFTDGLHYTPEGYQVSHVGFPHVVVALSALPLPLLREKS
jgi:hypothetical protein